MKKLLIICAILATVLSANISFADTISAEAGADASANAAATATATNTQTQNMEQTSTNNATVNNNSVDHVEARTNGTGTAFVPLNEYGHQVTQMGFGPAIGCYENITLNNFNTVVSVLKETPKAKQWDDIYDEIIPAPVIRQRFTALSEGEPVSYFPASVEEALDILRRHIRDENLLGLWVYNTELNKNLPVLLPYLKYQAYIDAHRMGANVVIPVDKFWQGYLVPIGEEFNVAGLISWLTKLTGYSVAASAGIARQQNTEFGTAGAAFIFLRVDNPADLCAPKPEVVIIPEVKQETKVVPTVIEKVAKLTCDVGPIDRELEKLNSEILWCDWPGRNNQGLRFEKGNAKLDKYYCQLKNGVKNTQLLDEAISEYGVAERDYLNGRELAEGQKFGDKPRGVKTTTLSEPTELDYKVHYNWALAVRELDGEIAEITHAHKYKLSKAGSKKMPDKHEDMLR